MRELVVARGELVSAPRDAVLFALLVSQGQLALALCELVVARRALVLALRASMLLASSP